MQRGKYISPRDFRLFTSVNNELMDDVMEIIVSIFKISPETQTNIYGEVSQKTGKWYYSPIEVSSIPERPEMTSDDEGFGVNRNQTHIFKFLETELKRINFYPEHGDLILYNDKYFEINNVVQEQLLGGQPDKSFSIICNTQYTTLSSIQIVPRI